jgi:polyprenyl-phospho-N-acetylgalactosaminyl synthase
MYQARLHPSQRSTRQTSGRRNDRTGVWVAIAAYNEARAIAPVLAGLRNTGHDIVVVDDGSTDGTDEVAAAARAVVVRHSINLGQGAALQTGITFALLQGAEFIVTFDADGQHRAAHIEELLAALVVHRADFVLGSRFLGEGSNIPASRRLLLRAATWFTRLTTGLAVTDAHNGMRAMTRRGAEQIHLRQNRMAHASEFLDQIADSGLKCVEVPVIIDYSHYSVGKGQRSSQSINILVDLFVRKLHP